MWCVWHFSTCVRGSGSQRPLLFCVAVIWLFPNKVHVYRRVPSKGRAQPCCNASPISPVLISCTQLTAKALWNRVTLGKHRLLWHHPVHSVTITSAFALIFLQAFSLSCCYLLPVSCTTAGLGLKIQTAGDHKDGPAARLSVTPRLVWGASNPGEKQVSEAQGKSLMVYYLNLLHWLPLGALAHSVSTPEGHRMVSLSLLRECCPLQPQRNT